MGSTASSALSARPDSVFISNLSPVVQCGRYPTKRVVGESVVVEADIFKDGHDIIVAVAGWRKAGKRKWHEIPMHQLESDRWSASLAFFRNRKLRDHRNGLGRRLSDMDSRLRAEADR